MYIGRSIEFLGASGQPAISGLRSTTHRLTNTPSTHRTMAPTTTTNTCTALALDDAELRMYMSTKLQALDYLVKSACDGCGALEPSAYGWICDRHVLGGGCCLKKKTAHFKICSDRRGDHKMCPVTGCRNAPRSNPVVDHRFTAVMLAGRQAVDFETHEAMLRANNRAEITAEVTAEVTAKVRAEKNKRVPSRKLKADCAPDEWEEIQMAKRMRKAERDETAEVNRHNAKLVALQMSKMVTLMGSAGYEAWMEEALAPAPTPAPTPAPIAPDCMECDFE